MSLYRRHATARLLAGRPVHLLGRLLTDETRAGEEVAVDPETGGEVKKDDRPAFVLSTEGEASDGHIVRQFWDLSRAESVGIPVLWSHDPQQLLGQWQDLRVMDLGGPALVGRPYLDPDDATAQMRRRQIRGGILRAVSTGWQPGEMVRRGALDKADPLYREAMDDECGQAAEGFVMGTASSPNRLVECSLVSVPAQSQAVVTERLYERAEAALGGALHIRNADIDSLLAVLADHPRARQWFDLRIAAAIRANTPAPATLPSAPVSLEALLARAKRS